jgi:hypothetical protein
MKVLIRNRRGRGYYAAPGQWVPDVARARDFQHAHLAREAAWREGLADSEIVLSSDNTGAEIVLPLRAGAGGPENLNPRIGSSPDAAAGGDSR